MTTLAVDCRMFSLLAHKALSLKYLLLIIESLLISNLTKFYIVDLIIFSNFQKFCSINFTYSCKIHTFRRDITWESCF